MTLIRDPLVDPPPAEVPLPDAPLVRVIAQIRFPVVLSVENREFVARFQEAVRDAYPVLRPERISGVVLSPNGLAAAPPQTAWRFSDVDENWRLSLTPAFLALETTRYTSRSDFLERLAVVLEALDSHVGPQVADRVGLRYIDRIAGPAVNDIETLVRPEVRGVCGTSIARHTTHSLTESAFTLPDAGVVARWGYLPPGATVDPSTVPPITEVSFLLDLDMFRSKPMPFAVEPIVAEVRRFSERIYTLFRWAVTEDFLRRYGGEPS